MYRIFGISFKQLLGVIGIGLLLWILMFLFIPKATYACGFFTPCAPSAPDSTQQQQNEQGIVNNLINKMEIAVPVPQLSDSLERKNISKRLTTFSDPNKVSYIYLVSFGRVMSFYTIKGKITSGNKRLSSTQRLINCDKGEYNGDCEMESPELDGTYGSSAPYVFFWTTDGVYVQWSGDYMLVDQPLKLSTQPELVREVK